MRPMIPTVSVAILLTSLVAAAPGRATPVGIPAQVVDLQLDAISLASYPTTDHSAGTHAGSTQWRVVGGTGNAAELWFTIANGGRILDLGGRYVNYSDDRGVSWRSVRPLEPLVNAEGAIVQAPNGDVVGVTWDPYEGDRVIAYKYSAADQAWFYNVNALHTPFWDRPGIRVVPGPFTTATGTVPYMTFIDGFPHDPWYSSTDGLTYTGVSSPSTDEMVSGRISTFLDVAPDPSFDRIQANMYVPFVALGGGRALAGTKEYLSPDDMRWHAFSMPDGGLSGTLQVDGRGWLHRVWRAGTRNYYSISTDGGRTWRSMLLPDGLPGDFRADAAAGVAAVWALYGRQDLVFKIDIRTDTPRLLRRYEVGLGDDCRCGSLATYGVSGGHRFDFSSIGIFPDGRVAVSFMDSTTTIGFPTTGVRVVAPALAIELDTTLS